MKTPFPLYLALILGSAIGLALAGCASAPQSHPTKTARKAGARSDGPRISYIDPFQVTQNTEDKIKVVGANFDQQTYPTLDAYVFPPFTVDSPTQMTVTLSKDMTSAAGTRAFGIHDGHTGDEIPGPSLTIVSAKKKHRK